MFLDDEDAERATADPVAWKNGPRFQTHRDMTCKHCGSVLSPVTFTCVRGDYCPGPTRQTVDAD